MDNFGNWFNLSKPFILGLVLCVFCSLSLGQKTQSLLLAYGSGCSDTDGQAFITTANITDATQKSAICQLVLDLKAASIWTKMTAIYPFVGGNATAHSYNLKNTAMFQITWNGTVTQDANGITGNGTTGYGNTNLNPLTTLTLNNTHLSIYSRTQGANESRTDFGSVSSGGTSAFLLYARYTNLFMSYKYNQGTAGSFANVANTDARGFFVASRRANNDFELYKNGSSSVTQTNTNGGNLPSLNVFICAANFNSSPTEFSNRNYSFASIGASLTDSEVSAFYTAVQAYETTLGRQV